MILAVGVLGGCGGANYFMMGDNRGSADDSRFWGPVPRAWIVGKVVGIVAQAGGAGGA